MTEDALSSTEIARTHFFFESEMAPNFEPLDTSAQGADVKLSVTVLNFRSSLRAIVDTLSVPYNLAFYGALHLERERLEFQETITAFGPRPPQGVPRHGPEHTRLVRAAALAALRDKWMENFERNFPRIQDHINNELARYPDAEHTSAPSELLRQSTVLLWGAVEVLIARCFRYKTAIVPKGTRKDLRGLYPEFADGHDVLKHFNLWLLFQRRHVIVHRASIVDKKYLEATADTAVNGARLVVSPRDLQHDLAASVTFGSDLLARCSASGPGRHPRRAQARSRAGLERAPSAPVEGPPQFER